METIIYKIAQGLADILGYGTVSHVMGEKMSENERGWSGAEVVRKKVFFKDGTSIPMIFKFAERKERCTMKRLTEQGQCTPAAYSQDVISDERKWMAMEDLGQQQSTDPDDCVWLNSVAKSLVSIHADNMGKYSEMPWLPVADEAYWKSVVTQMSVSHFERKMKENRKFEQEFGKYLPKLQAIGSQFANDMTALCKEKEFLTLTHGDLQMRDGAHIYNCNGIPRIIDFGFCRYAAFYIDLVGWFTADNIKMYYDKLFARGISLKYKDFEERARTAFRYNGFIYLCPSVIGWQDGSTERTGKRLLQALKIILDGDFPERRTGYSDFLFHKLVEEYS